MKNNILRRVIFMKTIEAVFKEFLDEQRQRLKPRTYGDYEEVVNLFVQYLNSYAYLQLGKEDAEHFDALYNKEGKEYCDILGPEYIGDSEVEEFLSYYMIRKVCAGTDFLKASVRVTNKLVKWLHANGHMNDEEYEETEENFRELRSDVPGAREFALLLFEYVESHPVKKYTEELSGYFQIDEIKPGKLWLSEDLILGQAVGPVIVSPEISSKARVGWTIYLSVGNTGKTWKPLMAGAAYPRFAGDL
jgi:hypothetical protein